MPESRLIDAARQWVIDKYPYNSYHLLKSLEWLDKLAAGAPEAVRLATLTHDMERAFPGPDQPVARTLVDEEYHAAHSARSSRIVGEWMLANGASQELIAEVRKLVNVHEIGGWPEADLVQAADSVSFLDCNIELFLGMVRSGKWSASEVRTKFDYSYNRIRIPRAKEIALPMLDQAINRLEQLELELSSMNGKVPHG